MGIFHAQCTIANVANRARTAVMPKMIVETGSEYTCVPGDVLTRLNIRREKKDVTFTKANGQHVTRNVGFAVIHVGTEFTVDEVVFAQPGDLSLLGSRSLEGLNLMVDPVRKKLVAAGPRPAASSGSRRGR